MDICYRFELLFYSLSTLKATFIYNTDNISVGYHWYLLTHIGNLIFLPKENYCQESFILDRKMVRIEKGCFLLYLLFILTDHCIQIIPFDVNIYPSIPFRHTIHTKHKHKHTSLCDAFVLCSSFLYARYLYAKGLRFSEPINSIDYDRATFNISLNSKNVP